MDLKICLKIIWKINVGWSCLAFILAMELSRLELLPVFSGFRFFFFFLSFSCLISHCNAATKKKKFSHESCVVQQIINWRIRVTNAKPNSFFCFIRFPYKLNPFWLVVTYCLSWKLMDYYCGLPHWLLRKRYCLRVVIISHFSFPRPAPTITITITTATCSQ